ncbi:MAG: TRAP transporter small permease [Synergistaceae bacterium]|nr:TRAP transporter small permease [Synergistaceae bacterium]
MINKVLDKATSVVTIIASVLLILIGLVVLANIIMRAIFNSPIGGTVEVVQYGMMTCAALILCRTGFQKRHIAVTLLVDAIPKRVGNIFKTLTSLICTAVFAIISWHDFTEAPNMAATGRTSDVLKLPIHYLYIIMAVGFLLGALVFLYWTIVYAISIFKPAAEESPGNTINK